MITPRKIWLVFNEASGSNDRDALAALEQAFTEAGFVLDRKVCFPATKPDRAMLEAEGVDLVAVFAGDGTTHWVVTQAYGWDGTVLVLPGGTMNLLSHRLHGDLAAPEIVRKLGDTQVRRIRPAIVRTEHGDGLSGVLAGPGAAWNDVREAMREADVMEMVATAREAIDRSANDTGVICRSIACGRAEGYRAVTLNPSAEGLEANGYFAQSFAEMAEQGLAMLRGDFRDGPHEPMGTHMQIELESLDGKPMDLLIDGEPFECQPVETFSMVPCGVDLVATAPGEPDLSDRAPAAATDAATQPVREAG